MTDLRPVPRRAGTRRRDAHAEAGDAAVRVRLRQVERVSAALVAVRPLRVPLPEKRTTSHVRERTQPREETRTHTLV